MGGLNVLGVWLEQVFITTCTWHNTMSEVIPPSSAPIPARPTEEEEADGSPECLPITDVGQICYERVIPSQAHFYKVPEPPKCTGNECRAVAMRVMYVVREKSLCRNVYPLPLIVGAGWS